MPFIKGKGKTGGRKRGVTNRTTKEAEDFLRKVLLGQVDNIKSSLESLQKDSDSRYLDACSKLFTYVLPRKTDLTSNNEKITPTMPTVIINTKKSGS
jgi:hypothetical protein